MDCRLPALPPRQSPLCQMLPEAGLNTERRRQRLRAAQSLPCRWIHGFLRSRACFAAYVSSAGFGTKLSPAVRLDPTGRQSLLSWAGTGTCWSGTLSPAPAAACWCRRCAAGGSLLLQRLGPPDSGLDRNKDNKWNPIYIFIYFSCKKYATSSPSSPWLLACNKKRTNTNILKNIPSTYSSNRHSEEWKITMSSMKVCFCVL